MRMNIPEYRPAAIDDELAALLEDFRSFRHKFRHSYTFELDWERERIIALKFNRTCEMLREQVENFLKQLEALEE